MNTGGILISVLPLKIDICFCVSLFASYHIFIWFWIGYIVLWKFWYFISVDIVAVRLMPIWYIFLPDVVARRTHFNQKFWPYLVVCDQNNVYIDIYSLDGHVLTHFQKGFLISYPDKKPFGLNYRMHLSVAKILLRTCIYFTKTH